MNFEQFKSLYETINSQIFNLLDNKKPEAIGEMLATMKNAAEDFLDFVEYVESREAEVPAMRRHSLAVYCRRMVVCVESHVIGGDTRSVEGMQLAGEIEQLRVSVDGIMRAVVDADPEEGARFDAEVEALEQINNECQPLLDRYEQIWDEVAADIEEFEAVMEELRERFFQTVTDVYGLIF